MNEPNLEKVKLTAKMRDVCTMFDAQIMVLDELIAQLEAENRNNPINTRIREKGKQLLQQYQQHQ